MRRSNIKTIVFTALFAALACVSTLAIRIPTPGTEGYIHPGDAIVIIAGVVLGPLWGAVAAGLGSALADVLGGYFIYAPVTFVIKAAVALVTGLIYRALRKKKSHIKILPAVFGGITDVILVAGGYFLYELPLYGLAAAAMSVPANLIQGAGGFVIAIILCPILTSIPYIERLVSEIYQTKKKK